MSAIVNGKDFYMGGGISSSGGSAEIQKYFVIGKICNSNNDQIEGSGVAVVKIQGNIAEIEYNYRITKQGYDNTNFWWGLNPELLQELDGNIPKIKPLTGGTLYVSDNTNDWGYAPLHEATTDSAGKVFWTPARIHELPNGIGAWTSDKFNTNSYIKGIAHGIIE